MIEMSASEASRNFSSVLDSAEHGETIAVTRGGHRVALIAPAPGASGRALREVFRKWQGNTVFDQTFEDDVRSAREIATADLDTDPWLE